MLVSTEWLRAFLPELELSPADIGARLTSVGLEVEGETRLADALEGVVVVQVKKVEPHPKADKLRLATVFDGSVEQTVVCGAPNLAQHQKVALARLGTTLANGLTMEPRKIRGVESQGMLCAEDELGLSDEGEGILVLPDEARIGQPLSEALGVRDVILEIGITPNRPDALSHMGIARDLGALLEIPVTPPEFRVEESGEPAASLVKVSIHDPEGCRRYRARVVSGVKLGPSPRWVQDRLRGLGLRPISNVVDATNIVLLELGQPLHAFDLDALAGAQLSARRAGEGETVRLLDGSEKRLEKSDLVIADAENPVALAGVMGGADSEVTHGQEGRAATTRVVIESAWFDPSSVRKTSRRHGLHTDASHRFERGTDPEMVERALDRCAALIADWADGTVHPGVLRAEGQPMESVLVPIRKRRATLLLGRPVDEGEIRRSLEGLGLSEVEAPKKKPAGALWFDVPSWRFDLRIEADLVEEVGRLGGYDSIKPKMPELGGEPWRRSVARDPEAETRSVLVAQGLLETISLAFTSPKLAAVFVPDGFTTVRLVNPLGEETRTMRPSLLPALLQSARHNQDQLPSITDLRLFELGRTFWWASGQELPVEENWLGCVFRGRRYPVGWASGREMFDVYDLKAVLEDVLDRFQVAHLARYVAAEIGYLHPQSATEVFIGDEKVGRFGELHPDVAALFDLEGPPVFTAEVAVDELARLWGEEPKHRPLPRLPPAHRDLSFFVTTSTEAGRAVEVAHSVAPPELESVRVFDVFEGAGVPSGMKSLALELVFRAEARTLSDAEVEEARKNIVIALSKQIGAQIRDS